MQDPVPLKRFCVFRYVDNVLWTTVGGIDYNIYRGNSLYDPDYTGAGAQPMSYDQCCALYDRFIVHGAEIKVVVQNMDAVPVYAVLGRSYLPTAFTSAAQLSERPDSISRYLGAGGSSTDTAVMKMYTNTKTILGYKNVMDDYEASHQYNGNPTKQWFYHFWVENDDLGNLAVNIVVEIKYYTMMTDRTHLQRS